LLDRIAAGPAPFISTIPDPASFEQHKRITPKEVSPAVNLAARFQVRGFPPFTHCIGESDLETGVGASFWRSHAGLYKEKPGSAI
jgi:hypothetical protein